MALGLGGGQNGDGSWEGSSKTGKVLKWLLVKTGRQGGKYDGNWERALCVWDDRMF